MNSSEKLYNELGKVLSHEEIIEAYVFPEEVSNAETTPLTDELFLAVRLQQLQGRSTDELLLSGLMQLKMELRDYFEGNSFEVKFSFPKILERYLNLIGRNQKTFAGEVDIHPTKLSRIINGKENPNIELSYRLERHCGNVISAVYWWRLHARKIEEDVRTNQIMRDEESHKVKNNLKFRA